MAQHAISSPSVKPSLTQRWKAYSQRHRQSVLAWTILTPMLIYYSVFAIIPVITNLALSFINWNGITEMTWAGLDNYIHTR